MIKYYSLNEIDKIKAQYYMIFGERSNGKSYAIKKRLLDQFFNGDNHEFVICKRYDEDMKTKTCSTMFDDLADYVLEKYNYRIKFYQGKWLAYPRDTEGKLIDCITMGYATSISSSDRLKGAQFPRVKTILLEEFMSMNAVYLPDEINLFINLVSTIFRNKLDCKVYMLGNAISKHSPYADALDIRLHRMKKGEILTKTYTNNKGYKTKFCIQRTENVDVFDHVDNEDKVVYNIFGASGVGSMITTGDFETGIYNLTINDITFSENLKHIPQGSYTLLSKKHEIPFYIKYEDYYYKTYLVDDFNPTLAFREIENINKVKYGFMINNKERINNCVNIKNIAKFHTQDKWLDKMLDVIINCIYQDNVIFLSNENGEDVYNAFRLAGLNI